MSAQSLRILENAPRFPDIYERTTLEQQLWNLDTVLPVSVLSANPDGTLHVPDIGDLVLTPWSKRQLALTLGIRWEKWFQEVTGEEAAEEINRRLSRTDAQWKLRTRKPRPEEPCHVDGILGALVSPTYTPIADSRVLTALASAVGASWLTRVRVWKYDITDRSLHLSILSRQPRIIGSGDTAETYYCGFHIRNSSVGFTALSISVYFLRLACTNGMLVAQGTFRLLYRTHRKIDDDSLNTLMRNAFSRISLIWQQGLAFLDASRTQSIVNPETIIKSVLRQVPGMGSYHKDVLSELKRQSLTPTTWDLIQAITHVARKTKPDHRFELERLAGNLLTYDTPPYTDTISR